MPGSNRKCKARHQGGNEMCCNRCGFVWDADDPEPPKCLTDIEIDHKRGRVALKKIRENLKDVSNG